MSAAVTEQHTLHYAILCVEWTQCIATAVAFTLQISRRQIVSAVVGRKFTKITIAAQQSFVEWTSSSSPCIRMCEWVSQEVSQAFVINGRAEKCHTHLAMSLALVHVANSIAQSVAWLASVAIIITSEKERINYKLTVNS